MTFACVDPTPGSGVLENTIGGGGFYTAETTGTTSSSTGSCKDVAGNDAVTPGTLLVKIDKTLPVLTRGATERVAAERVLTRWV